jgi:uncharacterized protein (DUF885 family)
VSTPDDLRVLAAAAWTWRAKTQAHGYDDLMRVERRAGWVPDWSASAVARRQEQLAALRARWEAIDAAGWSIPDCVDRLLVGSLLRRVAWELDTLQSWRRNAQFYVEQALGPFYELLLRPAPLEPWRIADALAHLERVPVVVAWATANLTEAEAPLARVAIARLAGIDDRLAAVAAALAPLVGDAAPAVRRAAAGAAEALVGYRSWLEARVDALPAAAPVGRAAYERFLGEIAFLPITPERLVADARRERDRALAFEEFERALGIDDEPALPATVDELIARQAAAEREVRAFFERTGFLTLPSDLPRYRMAPLPAYLEPLQEFGVTDDLPTDVRPADDAIAWVTDPQGSLGYFKRAFTLDPRLGLVHEGMHAYQLALSWRHPDPIRRRYIDSTPNEGIAFYAEEATERLGLFADSSYARRTIANFMRLRALRVEVDVGLALGTLGIPEAADFLRREVPMDAATAAEEAAFFAASPGQAISYQAGKLQLFELLAETRARDGSAFSLRAFHDRVVREGNVPIELQRWELLGLAPRLEA